MNKKTIGILAGSFLLAGILLWICIGYFSRISLADIDPDVVLTIRSDKTLNEVDERIYSQFLEHICHSVDGGLHAELIRNRSFEEMEGKGLWFGTGIISQFINDNCSTIFFGDSLSTNFEFLFSARILEFAVVSAIINAKDIDNYSECTFSAGYRSNFVTFCEGDTVLKRLNIPCRFEYFNWHDIRVRCEDRSTTVWCDDIQIIEVTSPDVPVSGMLGLRTMAGAVQFRDIKVRDLSGGLLFSSVPELPFPTDETEFTHWESYGSGKIIPSNKEPLNSGFCAAITSQDSETGLRQNGICIQKGEAYSGSVWIQRFGEGGKITVRLLDGSLVLDETVLPVNGDGWNEYDYVFESNVDSDSASIQIGFDGTGTVWLDQISLISEEWAENDNLRVDLADAIESIRPILIRWPGGAFASFYNWKDGIGPIEERSVYPKPRWDGMDTNAFGTDEFMMLCERVGAEPVLVINVGQFTPDERDSYIQNASDWLEYCNGSSDTHWGSVRIENGHPEPHNVRYWEIDNEVWDIGIDEYSTILHEFISALRSIAPDIEIIACGSRSFDWNLELIHTAGEIIDYISMHHYENPEEFASAPAEREKDLLEVAAVISEMPGIDIGLFYSEWNADCTDWRTGLYAAGILNVFERNGDIVKISSPALFLRHVDSEPWNNALVNFDNNTWFPAPNYVVMKLWRESYAPNRVSVDGHIGFIDAVATSTEDGETLYLKMINTADSLIAVGVETPNSEIGYSDAELSLIAPGDLHAENTLDNPDSVKVETRAIGIQDNYTLFELPAFSAAVLKISD